MVYGVAIIANIIDCHNTTTERHDRCSLVAVITFQPFKALQCHQTVTFRVLSTMKA